jgi:2-polyprenyl-3-methyl-5-hydroxy-6-metoxy-1,4-benzoquinol methylase
VTSASADQSAPAPLPLSREEAVRYWDQRHRSVGDLRSGGHIGLSEVANEIFYRVRLGKLLELIGNTNAPAEPMFVLDAGCGKGRFARELAACGFCVDGIDTSEAAIEASRAAGGARFEVASLASWRNPTLYDVVISIDVLFHILDDGEWAASLANLASLTRLGGLLIVTDEDRDDRRPAGNYIVHRPRRAYANLLGDRFHFLAFTSYRFRENEVGFLQFQRVA